MPYLTFNDENHKRRAIQAMGFNPNDYDVDPNTGNVFQRIKSQPVNSINSPEVANLSPSPNTPTITSPQRQSQRFTPIQSGLAGVASGVLPTAGGFGAAMAAQPLILPLAAATGPAAPLTEIGLTLAAGIGGGALVNKIQDALMPNSIKENIAVAQSENPRSFLAGGVASQLPFMRINPKAVAQAGRTAVNEGMNILPGRAVNIPSTGAEIANLKNVVLSGGLPAGMSVAEDVIEGRPVNIPSALAQGVAGSFINTPTQLGQRLLRLPANEIIEPKFGEKGDLNSRLLENSTRPSNELLANVGENLKASKLQDQEALEKRADIRMAGDNQRGEQLSKTAEVKPFDEVVYKNFKSLVDEGKFIEGFELANKAKSLEPFRDRYLDEKTTRPEDLASRNKRMHFQGGEQGVSVETPNVANNNLDTPSQPPELEAATRLKESARLANTEDNIRATKEFFDKFNKVFGERRGIKAELNNDIPVRGQIDKVRNNTTNLRVAEINPSTATPDTLPHEYAHSWFEDLKNSPNRHERQTAKNLERAISSSREFQAENSRRVQQGKSAFTPEEFLAETSGYEIFKRAVNLDKENGTLRRGWKDFLSRVKLKWGGAEVQDVQSFVSKRFLNDENFQSQLTTSSSGINNNNNNNQDINNASSKTKFNQKQQTDRPGETAGAETAGQKENSAGEEVLLKDNNSSSTPNPRLDPEAVSKMTASEFKEKMSGFTKDAFKYGESIKGDTGKISRLKELSNLATEEFKAAEGSRDISKFKQDENQGLKEEKNPNDIVGNIKTTLASPEFTKASAIKRGLNEVKNRLPVFGSDLDKLKLRTGVSGRQLAPAIGEALAKADALEGRYLNPSIKDWKGLSKAEQEQLYNVFLRETKGDVNLREELIDNEKLLSVYDAERTRLKLKQDDQIEANQPVEEYVPSESGNGYSLVSRLPKVNPNYFPQVTGSKQLDIILNYRDSQAAKILKDDFLNHVTDKYDLSPAEANELFEDVVASYGGPLPGNTTRFGAVRKAEGIGLPESWLEVDPVVALRRYWRRVAKDRSWFDAVEKDPNNLYILGHQKDAWGKKVEPTKEGLTKLRGNKDLEGVLETIQGVNIKTSPTIDAVSRIANNMILGPMTGASDLVSALPIISKFIPSPSDTPRVIFEAIKGIGQGIKNARATGRIKENVSDVEDIFFPSTENVERLRQIGDGIAKISGRQKFEEWSRGLSQSAGESIIKIQKGLAENGNEKAVKFLEGLAGPSKDWAKLDDIELASRIVDLSQGTYDVRGLPSWIINSQVAPFFRLMKWNVEQLNSLHKNVIIPATKGDINPLLMTLGSGVLGGYLVKELREETSGKKINVPTINEIVNSTGSTTDKIHGATYSLAAAMSYSGVLGFLGEVLKTGADVSFKNKPQGLNYPMVEVVSDVADNIADATQAIVQEGENPMVVLPEFFKNLFSNNLQIARIGINHLGKTKDEKEGVSSRRDLRVYKQLSGKPYSAQTFTDNVNPYIGLEEKNFQRQSDPTKLPAEAGRLIKKAITDSKGDAGVLKSKLQKLKAGSVNTMPSIDNSPAEFGKYVGYLNKTVGPEETKKRIKSYGTQREVNKLRRGLIPSIN